MKFLTIAAICALASSVTPLKINHQLKGQTSIDHQRHGPRAGQSDSDRPHGPPRDGKWGGKGPKDNFDWSTFTLPCSAQNDTQCWNQWFSSQLTCKVDDKQCWGDSLKKLPCCLMKQKCWTDHIPTFPCKQRDSTCWNSILPANLPCKQGDMQCWKGLRKDNDKNEKDKNTKKQGHLEEQDQQDDCPLCDLFDQNEISQDLQFNHKKHEGKGQKGQKGQKGNKDKKDRKEKDQQDSSSNGKPSNPSSSSIDGSEVPTKPNTLALSTLTASSHHKGVGNNDADLDSSNMDDESSSQ